MDGNPILSSSKNRALIRSNLPQVQFKYQQAMEGRLKKIEEDVSDRKERQKLEVVGV